MRNAILLTALLHAAPAVAAFRDADAGTAAGQFLTLGADARAAGMGQAGRSLVEDATSIYWNPAGLAGLRERHASLTHGAYYRDVYYDFAAYARPIESVIGSLRDRDLRTNRLGALGVGLLYLNAGRLNEVDNTGTATGQSFTPQDAALIVAWGAPLAPGLDGGLAGKIISSRIQESASTGAFDAGLRYRARLGGMPVAAAAGLHNLGGRLKYIQQDEPLPLLVTLGAGIRPIPQWAIAVDLNAPRSGAAYPAAGTEWTFLFERRFTAALRAGYNGRGRPKDLETLAGLTGGAGLSVGRFAFDYAWAPFGFLGDTHRISLSYRY